MKSILSFFQLKSISQKIILGFIFIYILFIVNGIISLVTLQQSTSKVQEASKIVNPAIDYLDKFRLMVTQSTLFTFSWVYEAGNARADDKKNLQKIHENFPEFKDDIQTFSKNWRNQNLARQLDSTLVRFEALKKAQEEIMDYLPDNESYLQSENIQKAEKILNARVLVENDQLLKKLDNISTQKKQERIQTENQLLGSFNNLSNLIIILGTGLVFIGFLVNWWTRRQIVRPIKYINSVFVKLGEGEIPGDEHYKFNKDEIGEMADSADKLIYALRNTSDFAQSIGKGNYTAPYKPVSNKDILGNALLDMRNNLAKVAEEEKIRTWTNEGLVLFSEILKKDNDNLQKLSENIISSLVKYIKGNQGALFITADEPDENGEKYLTMQACYAWDTDKSYMNQRIYGGDGLAGQAWQEKATICLTDVPAGYIRITSGLGESNPSCILIVPLKINEEVFGVVELASFKSFKNFEIAFVEKIAESIASTVSTVKINTRTQKLLQESNNITEQMKAQEEETRMSMEALQSTQLYLETSQREAQEKDALLNTAYLIIETDEKFSVKSVNDLATTRLRLDLSELQGLAIDYLFFAQEKIDEGKSHLEKGVRWQSYAYIKGKNDTRFFTRISASAIRDEMGNVRKFLFIIDDITDAKLQLQPTFA